jgi:hypothetical protein
MHAVEKALAALLEAGEVPTLGKLGGAVVVAAAEEELSRSPFSPHVVHAALLDLAQVEEPLRQRLERLVCACFGNAPDDLTLYELNAAIEGSAATKGKLGDAIFRALADGVQSETRQPGCRGAAIEGLLRLSLGFPSRHLRLAAELLDMESGDPLLQPMLAKALGVTWSQVRDGALLARLEELAETPAGGAEAAFELGMAHLAQALEAGDPAAAYTAFEKAKGWFEQSLAGSEQRPAPKLYSIGIGALQALTAGDRVPEGVSGSLLRAAFELQAYNRADREPEWLGLRRTEAVGWVRLALTLDALARSLWKPAWWEPEAVVGQELLAAYTASRTLLRRNREGGIEALVRPQIEASLVEEEWRLHLVKEWVARHPGDARTPDANALLELVEAGPASQGHGRDAREALRHAETRRCIRAVLNAFAGEVEQRLPAIALEKIEDCLTALEGHADLKATPELRAFIGLVIYFTTSFVWHCIDSASASNRLTAYLFERDPEQLPKEGRLQDHYATVMGAAMGQAGIEVRAIGGGRADLVFSRGGDRLVVEVKRELEDARPETLFRAYGAQTEEYQNTSARVGILLVLDLTNTSGQSLHLAEAMPFRAVRRSGESADRLVFLFRVSGRRAAPSQLVE